MSVTEEQYHLIVKYIDQTLSKEDQNLFDNNIAKSAAFRKEVEQMEAVTAGLKAVEKLEEINEIKEVFKEFDKEDQVPKNKSLISFPLGLGIAASVSLIAFLAYASFFKTSFSTSDDVFNEYYELFPVNEQVRAGNTSSQALVLYDAQKYEEAIPLLVKMMNSSKNELAPIYLANAYLQTNKTDEAISILRDNISQESSGYTSQFYQWYLGLAFLKSQKLVDAKKVFINLTNEKGVYSNRSQEILVKLE